MLCSTDTDRRISIGPIRIRGYVKFLQNLKAQRCIGVSDTDTRICIGYVIRGHVEVSGLQRMQLARELSKFLEAAAALVYLLLRPRVEADPRASRDRTSLLLLSADAGLALALAATLLLPL